MMILRLRHCIAARASAGTVDAISLPLTAVVERSTIAPGT
jgi:hypothetical protein